MTGLRDDAHAREALERAKDRRARDAHAATRESGVHPVGGRVIVEVEDGPEDGTALGGEEEPLLAEQLVEALDALVLRLVVHEASTGNATTSGCE